MPANATESAPDAQTQPAQRTVPLYVGIARAVQWHQQTNENFLNAARARIQAFQELLPSGSGIDAGTQIDTDNSKPDKIILKTSFHHMNDGGMYDGWTEHEIHITPDLGHGFNLKVTGRDRRQIKEYLGELFHEVLSQEVPEYPEHVGHADTEKPCKQCLEG